MLATLCNSYILNVSQGNQPGLNKIANDEDVKEMFDDEILEPAKVGDDLNSRVSEEQQKVTLTALEK